MKIIGGKREHSGRKSKFSEPTKTVSFRVPFSKIEEFKKFCIGKILEYEKN